MIRRKRNDRGTFIESYKKTFVSLGIEGIGYSVAQHIDIFRENGLL